MLLIKIKEHSLRQSTLWLVPSKNPSFSIFLLKGEVRSEESQKFLMEHKDVWYIIHSASCAENDDSKNILLDYSDYNDGYWSDRIKLTLNDNLSW